MHPRHMLLPPVLDCRQEASTMPDQRIGGPFRPTSRAQGERRVRSRMVTGIARSSASTSSLYSEPMSVST